VSLDCSIAAEDTGVAARSLQRPRVFRTVGKVGLGALLLVAAVAAGMAWRSPNAASRPVQLTSEATALLETPAIEWLRGPFEKELHTASGYAEAGIIAAISAAESGCLSDSTPGAAALSHDPLAQVSTIGQFIDAHGTGILDLAQGPQGCVTRPKRPVPADLRTLVVDLGRFVRKMTREPDYQRLFDQEQACGLSTGQPSPEFNDAFNSHADAIRTGTYRGLPALRAKDRELSLRAFACRAEVYAQQRVIERIHVDQFLADPINAARIQAAADFIASVGESVPA
jgi:hypothetical protein